jgi:rhamnogalacturonyl hydrolase YesR
MALSIIARQQGIMTDNTQPSSALQAGIVQKAFAAHNAYHGGHPEIQEYMDNSTASAAKYMANTIDDVKNWPLDRLSNGNAMLLSYHNDPDPQATYALALTALRDSVRLNRRNNELGLWYWESYPDWSYLDGMYSLGPFAALDARLGNTAEEGSSGANATKALEDMRMQFHLLFNHCYNDTTGLLVHGYDASRKAPWASRVNGASAVVWGRSLGWFMMALVDTLEILSTNVAAGEAPPPGVLHDDLLGMYRQLAPAVINYADKNSRGWFQVVDMAGRGGNYVESSATAMFAYALLKGARLRYLDPNDLAAAVDAGRAAHALLVRDFVLPEQDDTLSWGGTVAVCSLNSTATYDVGSYLISSTFILPALSPFPMKAFLRMGSMSC